MNVWNGFFLLFVRYFDKIALLNRLSYYFFTHTDTLLIWKIYLFQFEQIEIVLGVIDFFGLTTATLKGPLRQILTVYVNCQLERLLFVDTIYLLQVPHGV